MFVIALFAAAVAAPLEAVNAMATERHTAIESCDGSGVSPAPPEGKRWFAMTLAPDGELLDLQVQLSKEEMSGLDDAATTRLEALEKCLVATFAGARVTHGSEHYLWLRFPLAMEGGAPRLGPVEEAPVQPALHQRQVHAGLDAQMKLVRYCYQKGLEAMPGLAGRLSVRFEILPDGTVGSAEVAEGGLGDEVESCILGRIRKAVFPAPRGGGRITMTYPLAFSPS